MITVSDVDQLRAWIKEYKDEGMSIGFVPTMGNLHAGHLELVRQARQHADKIVVSIFINPTQFGPDEDYQAYPRTLEQDTQQLLSCGVDLLFMPTVSEMYGDREEQTTRISVPGISEILCGASRPGHFDGVATIVSKLFNIVMPSVALFGEKDFQQLMVIRTMCRDLAYSVRIIGVATQRESDGLAMSSRNAYLNSTERTIAPRLFSVLKDAEAAIRSGAAKYIDVAAQAVVELEKSGFLPEYVEIRRRNDLKIPEIDDKALIILAAARLGKARLIDNLAVDI